MICGVNGFQNAAKQAAETHCLQDPLVPSMEPRLRLVRLADKGLQLDDNCCNSPAQDRKKRGGCKSKSEFVLREK